MAHSNSILGELDAEHLQNQGLLRPGQTAGSKRIHRRRLNGSSDEEYRNLSLDVSPNSPGAASAFATIPTTLISLDTLLYLGFTAVKANQLWQQWSQWPSTGPRRETDPLNEGLQVTFIDFITSHLRNYEDAYRDNNEQWGRCLNAYGMSPSVQNAIMDSAFKTIRLTNSCLYWVKDTLLMRYAGLEDVRRASQYRESELQRINNRRGSNTGSRGGRGGASQSGASGTTAAGNAWISTVLWSPTTAANISQQPNHLVLYKGMDQGRLHGLFNKSGAIQSLEKLLSAPPSDFSGTRSLFYFASDYKVAEYYAAYAKRRSNCESVVMVCLTIAKQAVEELEEPEIQRLYWPQPDWKQLVWRSKTNKPLPGPLRKYRDALLIIGNISKGASRMFETMQTWEGMSNSALLRLGGGPVTQYIFSGEEEGREFLEQHGKITAHGFSDTELQRVLATHR